MVLMRTLVSASEVLTCITLYPSQLSGGLRPFSKSSTTELTFSGLRVGWFLRPIARALQASAVKLKKAHSASTSGLVFLASVSHIFLSLGWTWDEIKHNSRRSEESWQRTLHLSKTTDFPCRIAEANNFLHSSAVPKSSWLILTQPREGWEKSPKWAEHRTKTYQSFPIL